MLLLEHVKEECSKENWAGDDGVGARRFLSGSIDFWRDHKEKEYLEERT